VAMVLAVLQQHAKIRLHSYDVFASTVGGVIRNWKMRASSTRDPL
jgi:predicted ATP-dependent serine protease